MIFRACLNEKEDEQKEEERRGFLLNFVPQEFLSPLRKWRSVGIKEKEEEDEEKGEEEI